MNRQTSGCLFFIIKSLFLYQTTVYSRTKVWYIKYAGGVHMNKIYAATDLKSFYASVECGKRTQIH